MAATMGGGGQPNPLAAAAAGSAARLPEQEEEPTLALGYAAYLVSADEENNAPFGHFRSDAPQPAT
jgi:hypothetical protein